MWNFIECFSLEWPCLHISFRLGICLCRGQFELIEFLSIFLHENHVGGELEYDVVQGVSL